MADALVRAASPLEFFREQLETAMEHQKVSTSAFTEHYLVHLLAGCVHAERLPQPEPGFDETPLALMYVRALHASRRERAQLLRALGDTALFVSGFFGDSLARGLADQAYYRAMGGQAYARLSEQPGGSGYGPEVYGELSLRFTQFADVLAEISESTRLTSVASVLQLYERWIQTGSPRAARLLQDQGLVPVTGSTRLQ
jgi:hypothetical protein